MNGGSVGGYTPAPTPVVTDYPYDLDNMSLSVDFVENQASKNRLRYVFISGKLSISGVTILDTTSVASVVASVHVAPGTDVWDDAASSGQIIEADIDVEIGQIMTANGGDAEVSNLNQGDYDIDYIQNFYSLKEDSYATLTSTTSTIAVTKITVYNANGIAIQEWTP